jgi:hypothetical protein
MMAPWIKGRAWNLKTATKLSFAKRPALGGTSIALDWDRQHMFQIDGQDSSFRAISRGHD